MFDRLKSACRDDWDAYIRHPFVEQVADGTLPQECFRHYLLQDYLFLQHFARAYALAIYKSETLDDMQHGRAALGAILDHEISLHVEYCREWGIDEAEIRDLEEATATMAYTRYVLERGVAGTLTDLHVALSPCVIGYAEIAGWIVAEKGAALDANPYRSWVEMYASDDYREAARGATDWLARAGAELTESGFARQARNFRQATRLEIGFWQMGLNRSM